MAAGVVKKLSSAERSFYDAADVMTLLDVSRDKAYVLQEAMKEADISRNTGRCDK